MRNQNITVALGQFAPIWEAIEENVDQMLSMIKEAGKAGADLIVFPELSRTGHSHRPTAEEIAVLAETFPSVDSQRIAGEAYQHKMSVVYGSLEPSPTGAYNTVVWLEEDKMFRYHKTHVHWTENFTPGESFPVFESNLAKAGALVCFDLAFPEAARTLALNGAELVVAPSVMPLNFKDISRRRVVARAVDNQVFVIYCNYTGEAYEGGSLVVDPGGEILFEAGTKTGVYLQAIDLRQVAYWRNYERIYDQRRPHIY